MPDTGHSKREQYWLRPLSFDHIPVITKWLEQVEDLAMFDRRMPVPLSATAVEREWHDSIAAREPRTTYWFIIEDNKGESIGLVGLDGVNYAHGDAVLPVFIAEPWRRKGIALRARALLLDLAFDQLRMARITSYHRADNDASRRLDEVCGLREEGCIRSGWFSGGQSIDLMVFGILAEEWRKHRSVLKRKLRANTVVTLGEKPWGRWSWPEVTEKTVAHRTPK